MRERIWVADEKSTTARAVIFDRRCRMKTGKRTVCGRPAAWAMRRSSGWWCYCEDHASAYGKRIRDGIVERQVAADSPAARRARQWNLR